MCTTIRASYRRWAMITRAITVFSRSGGRSQNPDHWRKRKYWGYGIIAEGTRYIRAGWSGYQPDRSQSSIEIAASCRSIGPYAHFQSMWGKVGTSRAERTVLSDSGQSERHVWFLIRICMVSTFFFYCECLIAHLISPGYYVFHSFLPYATFFIRFHSFSLVFIHFHQFSFVFASVSHHSFISQLFQSLFPQQFDLDIVQSIGPAA